ncbi:hypothetical protein TNCV_2158441 [Trichonephila clavipes]|nr:hypothetical protein TNCV_2158441 [Trichonephila clavipes]
MLQRHILRLICWRSLSLFISVKLPTILLLFNHLSNLSGKLSEFLEIGSYLWHKIIILDDARISLTTSLRVRNSLQNSKKAAVCPVVFAFGCVESKADEGVASLTNSHASLGRELSVVVSDP